MVKIKTEKLARRENSNITDWHRFMFILLKVIKGMGYYCLYVFTRLL